MLHFLRGAFLFATFFLSLSSFSQSVWINEIHYDNDGSDSGECIEISGTAGTDMSCYSIVLYNGNNTSTYDTDALSGTMPDEGCGFGAISICYSSDGIQNGGPADGIALINTCATTVIQFLSYEGTLTATNGPANGLTSTDIGVQESNSASYPAGSSMQLIGSGSSYGEFTWESAGNTSSFGSLNTTQSISPCGSNTITPISSPGPFNINCSTSSSASSNITFTSLGTFNAGNTFTVQISDASGSFASPIDIGSLTGASAEGLDPSGSINFTIPENLASGSGYIIQIVSDDPLTISSLTSAFTITQGAACTITTGVVAGGAFNIDCATGANGTVGFTSAGTFNSGNTFTVYMSDASGSFATPTEVGSLSGASAEGVNPSGSINITIPAGTISGGGYLFMVTSSDPGISGNDNGTNQTITLTGSPCITVPPHITSVIINSCNDTCDEGVNELVFGSSGDFSIDVSATNFNFSYTNSPPLGASDNFTDILTNNSTATDLLNDQCASSDPYIDANGTTIPPNSSWVLVNNDICVDDALDWSGLCNSGPIYVIYSSDPTWSAFGNFSNNGTGIRPYQTSITTTDGQTFTIDYETDGSLYPNSDGVFASFDADGGSAISYGDDNCQLEPVVLSSTLINFEGVENGSQIDLYWNVSEQTNNDYFYIDHSTDGDNWSNIGQVKGHGTSSTTQHYSIPHLRPSKGVNYYSLHSVDFDGTSYRKAITAVNIAADEAYFNSITQTIYFTKKQDVVIYTLDGKIIGEYFEAKEVKFDRKGVFLIRDINTGETQRIFAN